MSLYAKPDKEQSTVRTMHWLLNANLKSKKQDAFLDKFVEQIHLFNSKKIDIYNIDRKHYSAVMIIHRMQPTLFSLSVPNDHENNYKILSDMFEGYNQWKEDQPKIREDRAWDSFTDELQIGVQRILRDKGAASKEVFDAIADTVNKLKEDFSMNKKSQKVEF